MKYLSVCSGIEAATVAWHGLGWTPVAFAEIEAFPSAVLSHHYPTVPNLGDLTKYREWPEALLADVELLVGGTPCQAFSVAGKRQSLDDERGNLSLVYVNLYHHINGVRKRHGRSPAIALWENVPGVLSTKDNAFGCFIGGLLGCDEAPATESGKWDKAGFLSSETARVGYRVLDAQYFGVAQRRRRVFLVAVPCEFVDRLGEGACPSEILSLRESVFGNPPTRGEAGQESAGSTGDGVARCVTTGEAKRQDRGTCNFVAFHPTQDPISSEDGSTHAIGCGSRQWCATAAVAYDILGTTATNAAKPTDVHVPLRARPPGQSEASTTTVVAFDTTQITSAANYSKPKPGDPCHPLKVGPPGVMQNMAVRRLTPRECERLQGFPDDFSLVTYRGKPAADGPRYRALGNSMAVPVMWWLGFRIAKTTGQHKP